MARKTPEQRFWERVEQHGPIPGDYPDLGPCWIWRGSKLKNGYGTFLISNKHFYIHRFAFMLLVGNIPAGQNIDHICHNRICCNPRHLRMANPVQNGQNQRLGGRNTSGYKGVSWDKNKKRWGAYIRHDGRHLFLGYHDTPEDGYRAYCEAATKFFGEFACFG